MIIAFALAVDAGAAVSPGDGVPVWVVPRVPPASPLQEKYRLEPKGDGYVYRERAFVAIVARDGTVAFHDRRIFFDPEGLVSTPPPGKPETLQWLFSARAKDRPPPPAPPHPRPLSPADRPEPSEICPPGSCYTSPNSLTPGTAGLTMDLSDAIMRAFGQDPYRAAKVRFLAATFDLRMKLAAAVRRDDLRRSLGELPEALASLWGDSRYSGAERRRILFELWREADSTPEGVRAAQAIEAFIAHQLPCGSPDSYTAAELQAYQMSESGRVFSPYPACKK